VKAKIFVFVLKTCLLSKYLSGSVGVLIDIFTLPHGGTNVSNKAVFDDPGAYLFRWEIRYN
jgi:hypothetical protein